MQLDDLITLRRFVSPIQINALIQGAVGEEAQYFRAKVAELANTLRTMPATYEQSEKGDDAIAYLHYFIAGADWHITERDCDDDNTGQHQAFGLADLGYGPELGYISIVELIRSRAEIDLHWTPRTVRELIFEAA